MLDAIMNRRSIRKYKPESIPKPIIEQIIKAGIAAPSSKNRQPWKFVVATGNSKEEVIEVFKKGIECEKKIPMLPTSAKYINGAENTLNIMRQAPVLIFVANTLGTDVTGTPTVEERVSEICNTQSIGAAIENMILEATNLGLGSLWICDTYFAHKELCEWMNVDGEMCAALALGYADEAPYARPRKRMEDVVEWRG